MSSCRGSRTYLWAGTDYPPTTIAFVLYILILIPPIHDLLRCREAIWLDIHAIVTELEKEGTPKGPGMSPEKIEQSLKRRAQSEDSPAASETSRYSLSQGASLISPPSTNFIVAF